MNVKYINYSMNDEKIFEGGIMKRMYGGIKVLWDEKEIKHFW